MPKVKKTTKKKKPAVKVGAKKIAKKKIPAEKKAAVPAEEIKAPKPKVISSRYLEAVGRRKTAIARVRLWTQGEKIFLVNNKPYQQYFPTIELQQIAIVSFDRMKCLDKFKISAVVKGGGMRAQAEAVRHGATRALVKFNPDFRKRLKRAGFLTRDPRMKERRKFGLKKARRAPQWQKR